MNWLVEFDGPHSRILQTKRDPDGYEVFANFAQAKKKLHQFFCNQLQQYTSALGDLKILTATEISIGHRVFDPRYQKTLTPIARGL